MKLPVIVFAASLGVVGLVEPIHETSRLLAASPPITERVDEDATSARRRAVQRPAPPSHIMHNVLADDDLRYTNHASYPNTIRACIERTSTCITDTLAPGASITKTDVVRSMGRDTSNLELYTTGHAEIRGHFDALPTTLMTPERQNIPVMGENQTFQVYTASPGTAELAYLLGNGVERDRDTITLTAGTTTLTPRPLQIGEQLDLIPNGPALMTSTVGGVQYRAKALSEATGVHYVLRADAATTSWAKNPDPTGILTFATLGLPQDRDNTQSNYVKDYTALNWGATFIKESVQVPGSMGIRGMWVTDKNMPFLAWSTGTTQTQGATAENGFGATGAQRYNASINQLPPDRTITILAADDIPASYTITGYNDTGNQTGTIEGSLPIHGNTAITAPAGSTRVVLSAKNATNNYTRQPHILLGTATDGIAKAGYQVDKPAPKVSGEEYMEKWLDPYLDRGFFLNKDETDCLIDDRCAVKGYGEKLFRALYPTSNYPGTEAEFVQFLGNLQAEGKLATHKKPLAILFDARGVKNDNAACFALNPSGDICVPFDGTNRANVTGTIRTYEVERGDVLPTLYGGSRTTGPNIDYDPRFYTSTLK